MPKSYDSDIRSEKHIGNDFQILGLSSWMNYVLINQDTEDRASFG